ncbi:hypothetical protein J7E99_32300 [Streptomyces sp. ISL-44]|uniref:hypothetical protein n=1 Tax=Streptomyces sp. ISL-44 TaxID=2819184 RepID=UPI001BE852C9|nr:hypothetical protein [Streptomyces sp. ISL-44]MBT2545258.1 hypothetical protein [Streptomyces sp. ISL-44]
MADVEQQETKQKEIDEAITAELTDQEIASAMADIGVSADELRKEVGKRTEVLEVATSVERSRLQELEQTFEGMTQRLSETETPTSVPRSIWRYLVGFGLIFALSVPFSYLRDGPNNTAWVLTWTGLGMCVASLVVRVTDYEIRGRRRHLAVDSADYTLLKSGVETARQEWSSALRRAVAGLLREQINRRRPSYSLTLDIAEASGLAGMKNPLFHIKVPAEKETDRLIRMMPGGSIGIAGPRGVGKTTLLQQFCSKDHASPSDTTVDKPSVRVLLHAPVKYDAREFVLLLFSRVCAAVAPEKADQGLAGRRWEDRQRRRAVDVVAMSVLTFTMGWGIFLLVTTLAGWKLSPNLAPALTLLFVSLVGMPLWLTFREGRGREPPDEFSANKEKYGEDAAEAAELLRGLAYQQSVARTWSAGVKTPVGLEGGVSTNVTMTEKPMGFPELVARLNELLRKLAIKNRVFIGIDELDKIDSDDQVYQFINDIKGIFGEQGCFYLISISDNAMSSFERRGLPVRDAFDSSLDAVITVRPAELSLSQTLMRRWVIGMPEAFLCLCHVFSGGLPRDLIRVARELILIAHGDPTANRSLEALTRSMVHADLTRKALAVKVAAQRLDFEPEAGTFICTVDELLTHSPPPTAPSLLLAVGSLTAGLSSSTGTPEFARSAHDKLNRLRLETVAYVYFCATLIDIFDNSLVEERVKRLAAGVGDGSLAQLAEVRSSFEVNPRLAWATVSTFRKAHGLQSKPYPA